MKLKKQSVVSWVRIFWIYKTSKISFLLGIKFSLGIKRTLVNIMVESIIILNVQ